MVNSEVLLQNPQIEVEFDNDNANGNERNLSNERTSSQYAISDYQLARDRTRRKIMAPIRYRDGEDLSYLLLLLNLKILMNVYPMMRLSPQSTETSGRVQWRMKCFL